jgi:hypothetical protein
LAALVHTGERKNPFAILVIGYLGLLLLFSDAKIKINRIFF